MAKKLLELEQAKKEEAMAKRNESRISKQSKQSRKKADKEAKKAAHDSASKSKKQDDTAVAKAEESKDKSAAKGGRRGKVKAAGGERPGAKANKEAMEEVQRRLNECVAKEDFDKMSDEVQRSVAAVTVFRTQMKIFEKKF